MYSFLTAENKTLYTAAMEKVVQGEAFMHIFGTLTLTDGTEIGLNSDEENIIGQPVIETQIVESPDTFNIADMYVGTLDIRLRSDLWGTVLQGAEIKLFVSVDGCPEEIPMGVWDVQTADKTHEDLFHIIAYDHLARLFAPMPTSNSTGIIRFGSLLPVIAEAAEVTFTQTVDDLQELFPDIWLNNLYPLSFQYAPTCWLQVQYIAQYMGCYVIANRQGEIEFRRYSDTIRATVTAQKRLSAQISDSAYSVRGFGYTDKYGRTVEVLSSAVGSSSKIYLSQDNVFIEDQESDGTPKDTERIENYYKSILEPLCDAFALKSWYTGNIDYYGDPTFDVGDMIAVTGGAAGSMLKKFLICHNTWQFRGAQTLISGGAPRAGNVVTSSGGGGGAVYSSTSVNVTKTIVTVPLTVYEDMLLGNARTAAIGGISAKEQTQVFITCTFQLLGTADSTAPKLTVTVDGERVGTAPQITLGEGDRGTIAFTCPVQVSGGNHTVKILAENYAEISGTAEVSGQNISAHTVTADLTDWEYETDENSASVTGYSGSEVNVEIPDIMGGKTVKIIKESAFEGSAAETVYIPEGVEKIE